MKRLISTVSPLAGAIVGQSRLSGPGWTRVAVVLITGSTLVGLWLVAGSPEVGADEPGGPTAQVSQGQAIYEQRCAACHGLQGDGAGPGAERLFIKPRDFTRDEYKLKSTAGDEFPSRDDLIRVITEGMPGSSMPGWEGVLARDQIGAVADYLQTLGRFFSQEGYGTTVIEMPGRETPSSESLARGKELFESDVGCAKCHGFSGRGNGQSALELTDNVGTVVYPADLTQPWLFRGGFAPEDIFLRLRTGMAGSPMPSFADALSAEDTWHLTNYVLSLSAETPPEPAVLLVSQFVQRPLTSDANDPVWNRVEPAYYPLTGQLMLAPRHPQPAINAVSVKSVYNDTEIAFQVSWTDRTETSAGDAPDALAIQFPQALSDGLERPYFVFGESARPVYLWYWAAAQEAATERNARGLRAIAPQPEDQRQLTASANYDDGRWQVVLRRPLQTEDEDDLQFETDRFIPVAFMAWDGFADEVETRLGLTTWSVVFLQSPTPVIQFVGLPVAYVWIPAVAVAVLVLELVMLWLARRANVAAEVVKSE
jgi:DMSO reductase family type II enzyme heme b subunit